MKAHKYWSVAMIVCMIMVIYTGHKLVRSRTEENSVENNS